MAKILTIELPDNLESQLGIPNDASTDSLEQLVLQTLETLAKLISSLQNQTPGVRVKSAETLGLIGGKSAVSALTKLLNDENELVRQAAASALRHIKTDKAMIFPDQRTLKKIDEPISTPCSDQLASLIGTLDLGSTDLAENHDHYLAQNFNIVDQTSSE